MNNETLYAILTVTFIQVDADKILYIDGRSSFDARSNTNLTFLWSVEGFSNIALPSSQILTLTPDQRNNMGLNQPGRYYNYTLRVMDSTQLSDPAIVTV